MDAVIEILKGLDYSPLYVSLKTGIVATIFSFFLVLFAARKVIKAGPKVKARILPASSVQQKTSVWNSAV